MSKELEDALKAVTSPDEAQTFSFGDEFDTPEPGPESHPTEIKYDRWGRYANLPPIPGHSGVRTWTRASTIAKTLDDTYHLDLWKQRQVIRGIAKKPDLLTPVQRTNFNHASQNGKGTLNNIASTAMEIAGSWDGANAGTSFHDLAERFDRGDLIEGLGMSNATDDELRMLDAYSLTLKSHGIVAMPELMERIVVVPALGVAGRFDRVYLDQGVLRIGDLKSQKWEPGSFDTIALGIQLGIYANAKFMLDQSVIPWKWVPLPKIDKTRGIVAWVPATDPGQAEIYDVDLVKGFQYARAAVRVREWRRANEGVVTRRPRR